MQLLSDVTELIQLKEGEKHSERKIVSDKIIITIIYIHCHNQKRHTQTTNDGRPSERKGHQELRPCLLVKLQCYSRGNNV